jgi:UDP-2,4-diacetamido-2,4,6-trideoxy-beta-L-altropyranose hydrolase
MKLLFRADGNARIGTGHIMRCLSLARGCKRSGGEAIFAVAEIAPSLEHRLRAAGIEFVKINSPIASAQDARETIQLAQEQNADWIVADGYSFGADYQRQIKQTGYDMLLVDDYVHADSYCADLVLNQNLHANIPLYDKRDARTRLLLGTRYALLREDFLALRNYKRVTPAKANNVLVTLGGADPDNVTGKILEALFPFDINCKIVIGGSNPHLAQLQSEIRNSKSGIELLADVSDMPGLMAWADIAIAAGGTTSWELAFMGVPSLMFILAENQRLVVDALATAGVACKTSLQTVANDLRALITEPSTRQTMSEHARHLVDGLGVSRVLSHLRAAHLHLRRVGTADCRQIWEWSNDAKTRAVSFSQDAISWDDHVKWFSARISSPDCYFYSAADRNENPVGQIRFDVNADEATLSVSLAKEFRGHGYGSALIVKGAQRCFRDSCVNLIRAYVKPTNEKGIRAFERTDFSPSESVEQRGQAIRKFILKREAIA